MADNVVVSVGSSPEHAGDTVEVLEPDKANDLASATVEVAAIEADRDITIAAIHAESAAAQTSALLEAQQSSELDQCRLTIAALETEAATLREALATAELTPASEPPANQPEGASEDAPPEVVISREEAERSEPEEPAKRPKKLRWI